MREKQINSEDNSEDMAAYEQREDKPQINQQANLFVRKKTPLVHCITNYVTVQDVANMILACGGSPIMADDKQEAAQITAASDALVLNLGTLQERTAASMLLSGYTANQKRIPIVLDPVGAGGSEFRNKAVEQLLKELTITVIRGNYSELAFLAGEVATVRGVDSAVLPQESRFPKEATGNGFSVRPMELPARIQQAAVIAQTVARRYHCLTAMTGAVDIVTDGERTAYIRNGVLQMSRITGTGCMLSGVVGAYVGANEDRFGAVVSAVASMGIAGELSWEQNHTIGLGSFHCGLFDAMGWMDDATIAQKSEIQYEERERTDWFS